MAPKRAASPGAYPAHALTAGKSSSPAVFAAAVSVAAAAAAVSLTPSLLAASAALIPAAVAAAIGFALLLIALNNITDYHTNFAMVEHVLAMDAMIPALGDITVKWRAVTSATLCGLLLFGSSPSPARFPGRFLTSDRLHFQPSPELRGHHRDRDGHWDALFRGCLPPGHHWR